MTNLAGKIAIITGGSKGMGLGIAQAFSRCGAAVVLCSNDTVSLDVARNSFVPGARISLCESNVASAHDMQSLTTRAVADFGGVDILVNSAGIQRYGTVTDTEEETWDEVFDVNVKGIYLASRYAIPEMIKRGGGSIINIASVQAYASQDKVAAYTASKGAILSLTRAMALDHAADRIRVNAICPASVDTPMLREAAELWKGNSTVQQTLDAWGRMHPVGRIGTPDEIAHVALLMAGDNCRFMTGADIKVDGGVMSRLPVVLPD